MAHGRGRTDTTRIKVIHHRTFAPHTTHSHGPRTLVSTMCGVPCGARGASAVSSRARRPGAGRWGDGAKSKVQRSRTRALVISHSDTFCVCCLSLCVVRCHGELR